VSTRRQIYCNEGSRSVESRLLANIAADDLSRSGVKLKGRGVVLVVDDYDDARQSLREALESAGHAVLEAANGQQALNLMVSRPDRQVSLIVLDLQMPVMDGWRLLDVLRCYVRLANIPVIVVTGHDPHVERIRHPNLLHCVRAPYDMRTLLDLVDASLTPDARTHAS
jgi:CheY-like chemotaxis protein